MAEFQAGCMQGHPPKAAVGIFRMPGVEPIAKDGVAGRRQVSANLMRSPGLWLDLKQSQSVASSQPPADSPGGFAMMGINHSAVPSAPIHAQPPGQLLCFPDGHALHNRQVGLGNLAAFELAVQMPVGLRVARQHDQAAGILVQAVNDPEPADLWLEERPQMGLLPIVAVRQGEHAGGLIDNHQAFVHPMDEGRHRIKCHWGCLQGLG